LRGKVMAGLEVVPARLWRLGEREIARKRHRVWFAPVVDDDITHALAGKAGILVCIDAPNPGTLAMVKLAPVPLCACAHLRKFGLVIEDFESQFGSANNSEIGTSLALLSERVVHIYGRAHCGLSASEDIPRGVARHSRKTCPPVNLRRRARDRCRQILGASDL
jgi:hypothetical protein